MREQLIQYVELLFAGARDCEDIKQEILQNTLDRYDDLENDVEFLSKYSTRNNCADFAGRIIYDDNGVEVFSFGKYKGQSVEKVFEKEPSYYDWIMNGDFPQYTKKIITEIRLRARKF